VIAVEGAAMPTANDPTISLHTLTGIQPHSGRTMQVSVTINWFFLTALLEFGSTHNFMDTTAVERVRLVLLEHRGFHVAIINGDRIDIPSCYRDLRIMVGDEQFFIDCYGLALGSYGMVLDVQRLESLGPILRDFCNRTMPSVRRPSRHCLPPRVT
jgi:hypothetical protein